MPKKDKKNESKEYVLKMAKENDVRFIRLWFTDILGVLKSFAISVDELEGRWKKGWASTAHQSRDLPALTKATWWRNPTRILSDPALAAAGAQCCRPHVLRYFKTRRRTF